MGVVERNGRFAVRIYLGRDEDGRQRFEHLGTYPTLELAEEAERAAKPSRARRCTRCRVKFRPDDDRRLRCDRCLRKLRADEPTYDDHWVYYCWDANGELLYVGVTSSGIKRFRRHGNERSWWPQVSAITVTHFATATEAREHERLEIARLLPPHNRLAPRKAEEVDPMGFWNVQAKDLREGDEILVGSAVAEEFLTVTSVEPVDGEIRVVLGEAADLMAPNQKLMVRR